MNDLLWQIAQDKRGEVCRSIEQRPLAEASEANAKTGVRRWVIAAVAAATLVIVHALVG